MLTGGNSAPSFFVRVQQRGERRRRSRSSGAAVAELRHTDTHPHLLLQLRYSEVWLFVQVKLIIVNDLGIKPV